MKYFKIIALLVFTSVISFYGCKEDAKTTTQEASKSVEVSNEPATPQLKTTSPTTPKTTTPNPATKEPAQNERGVWHYTCSKGCAGGAGSAVNCTNCGTTLAHNKAYHSNTNTAASSAPFASPTAPVATKAPEPSQNKAGVWHYTCSKGCAGGAGSASACGTCGEALKHNQAYHQ